MRFLSNKPTTLQQPAAVARTDNEFADLAERKGKLWAEVAFFLFSVRVRNNLDKDKASVDALAALTSRFAHAVMNHAWPEQNRLGEMMDDVDHITELVFNELVSEKKQ